MQFNSFRASVQAPIQSGVAATPARLKDLTPSGHLCLPYGEPGWRTATTFWGWQINDSTPSS